VNCQARTSVSLPYSHFSTTVMADKLLPVVDACHIAVPVHVYKYWPLFGFTPTLCNCDTSHKIFPAFVAYLFEACRCIHMTHLYMTSGQLTCVETLTRSCIR
jgi:hypothetical protein